MQPSSSNVRQPLGPAPKATSLAYYIPVRVMRDADGDDIVMHLRPVQWMTLREAARALGCCEETVRRWCHRGMLVWQRRGPRCMWVSAASVSVWLSNDSEKNLDAEVSSKLATQATERARQR